MKMQRFYPILILSISAGVYYGLLYNLIWNDEMIKK